MGSIRACVLVGRAAVLFILGFYLLFSYYLDTRITSSVISLIKGSKIVTEQYNMTDPKAMVASIVIKTTNKNAIIWEEKIDSKTGYLKV